MVKIDEKIEEMIGAWAKARGVPAELILTQIVNWAFRHAPKNIDEFDEFGIPYMDAKEQAEIEAEFAKEDSADTEVYTQEEVRKILRSFKTKKSSSLNRKGINYYEKTLCFSYFNVPDIS